MSTGQATGFRWKVPLLGAGRWSRDAQRLLSYYRTNPTDLFEGTVCTVTERSTAALRVMSSIPAPYNVFVMPAGSCDGY